MTADLAIKPSLKDAMDLWRHGNDTGDGYAPDDSTDDMTPRQAAEAAGMTAIEHVSDGYDAVIAWDVYTWVVVADCNGPWAVDVAVDEEVGVMRVTQEFLTWARSVEPGLNAAVGEQWDDESMWVPLPGGGYAGYDAGPEANEAIQHARACWDLFHAGDRTAAAAALRSAIALIE